MDTVSLPNLHNISCHTAYHHQSLLFKIFQTYFKEEPSSNIGYTHLNLSFLLLCWQLILYIPNWKVFKCIKSPTVYVFMEAYHVPYTPKHRYWTGLLLLARAIVYLIATANVSGDPQIQLISIIFILICIILLKMFIATKIFKRWLIDSLESFFYFNIDKNLCCWESSTGQR
jgi:hypothetical protein